MSEVVESVANAVPTTTETEAPATPPEVDAQAAALLEAAKSVFGEPEGDAKPPEASAEGEAAPDASAEAAKPAEDVKKPVDAKTAERIARAHRAEERVQKQLAASKSERQALAAEREQIARERQEMLAVRAQYEKLKSGDPLEILDAIGADKLDFVKRVASAPEVVDPIAARLAAAEARAAQAEQRHLQAEQERAEYAFRQNVHEAKSNFVNMLDQHADKFPNIVKEFTPDEAADRAFQLTAEHNDAYRAKFGKPIDDAAVAEYLEYEAEQRSARRTWGQGRQASQQSTQSSRTATGNAADVTHTLTNSEASTASVAQRAQTQEEIDAECIRLLNAASRAG